MERSTRRSRSPSRSRSRSPRRENQERLSEFEELPIEMLEEIMRNMNISDINKVRTLSKKLYYADIPSYEILDIGKKIEETEIKDLDKLMDDIKRVPKKSMLRLLIGNSNIKNKKAMKIIKSIYSVDEINEKFFDDIWSVIKKLLKMDKVLVNLTEDMINLINENPRMNYEYERSQKYKNFVNYLKKEDKSYIEKYKINKDTYKTMRKKIDGILNWLDELDNFSDLEDEDMMIDIQNVYYDLRMLDRMIGLLKKKNL
jgi:hypothetical protein